MASGEQPVGVARVGRALFGVATIVTAAFGFAVKDEPRLFAASAAFGAIWWAWDLLLQHVFAPLERWVEHLLSAGPMTDGTGERPSLDDTIRLLESHLANPTTRRVDINAAIRLEEIYRLVKKDPARARDVIRVVRERYPDAPELRRYDQGGMSGSPAGPSPPT